MKVSRLSKAACAIFALGILANTSPSFAQESTGTSRAAFPTGGDTRLPAPAPWQSGFDAMLRKAGQGRISLIFTLNGKAIGLSGAAANAAASIDADPKAIASGQSRIVAMLKEGGASDILPIATVPFIVATVSAEQLRGLAGSGLFADVEENIALYPSLGQSLPLMQIPAYWTATTYKGSGQIVAVIDTGVVSAHPFLAGRKDIGACISTVNTQSGIVQAGCTPGFGPGFGEPCTIPQHCMHGTHVAGIAVGRQFPGKAINGVAPDAKFMPIQIFGLTNNPISPISTHSGDLLSALTFVRNQKIAGKRIAAINLSVGSLQGFTSPCLGSIENMIKDLRNKGVATIIASGNGDANHIGYANAVSSPGCSPSAITVAATDKSNAITTYSNLSAQVDLLATGGRAGAYAEGIESSIPTSSFAATFGTSMAAPHVAGAFALLRQKYPCHSVTALESKLKSSGLPKSRPGSSSTFPLMQLNAARAQLGNQLVVCELVDNQPR